MFVAGATARTTAEMVGYHRNTANSFLMPIRRLIADKLPSCEWSGEVEKRIKVTSRRDSQKKAR
jgi:hypothetical protein